MRSNRIRCGLVVAALAALVVACADRAVPVDAEVQAELERLRALGYVDYSPRPAEAEESGVTLHDPSRSQPGYRLYTVRPLARAELIDLEGDLRHAWSDEQADIWSRSLLLEDGDLLVVASALPERWLVRYGWNNDQRWRIELEAHHDLRPAPDGRIATLTMGNRQLPAVHATVPVRDNAVGFIDTGSGEIESVSLYEAVAASPGQMAMKQVRVTQELIDLIHANSVRFVGPGPLAGTHPAYEPGNVLVCMRNQDTVAMLDPGAGELRWAWGQGELEGPHDATLLDNGNVLIFDNGVRRAWSRVVEVDPKSGAIVWEYRAPTPQDFFTRSRGGVQRLPNGNTLITQSNDGRAFEVTPEGEIVWEFYVPHLDEKGHRATIIRLYHYDAAMVEPLLGG